MQELSKITDFQNAKRTINNCGLVLRRVGKEIDEYQKMCEQKDKIYLKAPKWMKRKRKPTIEVDSCCAEIFLYLWSHGIDTLYHCCGHSFAKPYIILMSGEISQVRKLISQKDARDWQIW